MGSTPTRGTCPNDFSHPIDQDIGTQSALSWKIVVSECQSVIAVSLNIGSGVRLIKPAKLYMSTQTHYKRKEDGRMAQCERGHGYIPLSHSGSFVMRFGLHSIISLFFLPLFGSRSGIH